MAVIGDSLEITTSKIYTSRLAIGQLLNSASLMVYPGWNQVLEVQVSVVCVLAAIDF
jgi:hypothetical protein